MSFPILLWQYIRPYKIKFFFAVFCRLTSDIAQLYPIWALGQIVSLLTQGFTSPFPFLMILIGWLFTVVYQGIVREGAKFFGFQVAEQSSLDFLNDCLEHIFLLDFAWQEKENSGNKMKRIDKAKDAMNDLIRQFFVVLIEVSVNTGGIILFLFSLERSLSLALCVFIVIYYWLGIKLLKKAIYQANIVNQHTEEMYGFMFELLNNIRTVKSLALNHQMTQRIRQQATLLMDAIKKRIFWYRTQSGTLNTFEMVFEFVMVCVICWGIIHKYYDISLLIVFVGFYQKVTESTRELTEVTQNIVEDKITILRALAVLRTPAHIEDPQKLSKQVTYPHNWQKLSIRNVSFQYHNAQVLKNINLTIHRGEKVGIVGLSGAGKSTLFKLLLDLYEDYEGDILLDDISLRDIRRQSYIEHVSAVLQETELFNMSIKDNILLAGVEGKEISDQQFADVLRVSHLNEFIEKLPLQLQTVIGEKGIKLSGGQRQRLGIARALYRQPDLLLFDEATSHLDVLSEKYIQSSLDSISKHLTTIVIAHRLSTIKHMDKIVVLEKGHIIEEGSFDELIKIKGHFAHMWHSTLAS